MIIPVGRYLILERHFLFIYIMEKAILIIENKIIFLERYIFLDSFKTRILILKDILIELKGANNG